MRGTYVLSIFLTMWGLTPLLSAEPVRVASLSTVLTDLARNVGGDRVEIQEIVKAGIDPHDFEPTPGDLRRLSEARLILASGLGFESYLAKLRGAVGSGPRLLVVGEQIKPLMMKPDEHDHDHGHDHAHQHAAADELIPDPHWWHSISNVQMATNAIRDALTALDPDGRAVYAANAKRYNATLDELSRWTRVQMAKLPKERRVLVTSHDALGYLARDYEFTILPVEGVSTNEQPSSKKVRALIATIRETGVPVVFAENIENPKVLVEITRETGATLGGVLFADGLGEKEGSTYEAMMRHNVSTIVGALLPKAKASAPTPAPSGN